ncbi:site-specific integrase [Bacillus sp. RG28]|uniref:Site-specific integrase n=1 Tax=Gottfriedia endophytica TaxID=2820819 RepID=A0A940SI14_9BACI|nr:tyrosine-type recombinase/integrase [Gottfriedia endophytica]MBP0726782.1 site-specific integrase [Gottfriedia endophytica]
MASFQKYTTKQGQMWQFITEGGTDPKTGKRKQIKRRGFKTKKGAQIAAAQLEQEIANGTYIKEHTILFKDFVQEWLQLYAKRAKISSVRGREKQIIRLLDYFAHLKMKDITRAMYQKAIDDLFDKGYAQNTLDGIHSAGSMIFKKAVELQIITTDPTDFFVMPKRIETVEDIERKKQTIKYLEKEELKLFLDTAKEKGLDNDYMSFLVLAYSGIRSGELLALQWKDIDFVNNTLSVTKTLYNPNNNSRKYTLLTPKTQGSIRTIKIDETVIKELKRHKTGQNELKMMNRNQYVDKDFVFADEYGYPSFHKRIQSRMQRLLKVSGITKSVTPHSFRHTHTSLLIEAGVGVKEVQQRLGHSDINTTMDIYAHMTKNMEEKASQKFSELMRSFIK